MSSNCETSPSNLYAHDYFWGKEIKEMPDYPVHDKYVQIGGIVIIFFRNRQIKYYDTLA